MRTALLVLPLSFPPNPLHHIHECEEHRHLNQGPHGRCERLVAVGSKRGDGNRDGQFEIVAGGGETLRGGQLVSEAELVGDEQGEEEDDREIDEQRRRDSDHGHDLMHHLMSLRGKEYQDGEQEADQGPWVQPFEEGLVSLWAYRVPKRDPRDDGGP